MLFAHPVPHHIVIGETLPTLADLGSVAEGGGVEIGEDAEGDFGRSDRQKVNSEERLKMVGEERELGHTTLGQEAAEDELAMACWCRSEEGPDVRDNLLVLVRQSFDILIIEESCMFLGGRVSHLNTCTVQRAYKLDKAKQTKKKRKETICLVHAAPLYVSLCPSVLIGVLLVVVGKYT